MWPTDMDLGTTLVKFTTKLAGRDTWGPRRASYEAPVTRNPPIETISVQCDNVCMRDRVTAKQRAACRPPFLLFRVTHIIRG